MAWFGFAEKTTADGEQGAGAGMESVEGLSSRSACVTVVGGPQALPSQGGVRKCERAGHVSPAQQLGCCNHWSLDPPWAGPACPVFLPGLEESGQALAKSNICERVPKSPPESWFWHRAPLQLIPTRRAGLAGVGTGMSIPPFQ